MHTKGEGQTAEVSELGQFVSARAGVLTLGWAVVAGLLAIIVITTLVDTVLHMTSVFPPMDQPIDNALALLATSYRILISVGAAWLTARLAPDKPMKHAMILGYIGVVLGLVGVVATWNRGLGPRWYPILLVVLAIPQCWLGARSTRCSLASGEDPF